MNVFGPFYRYSGSMYTAVMTVS